MFSQKSTFRTLSKRVALVGTKRVKCTRPNGTQLASPTVAQVQLNKAKSECHRSVTFAVLYICLIKFVFMRHSESR